MARGRDACPDRVRPALPALLFRERFPYHEEVALPLRGTRRGTGTVGLSSPDDGVRPPRAGAGASGGRRLRPSPGRLRSFRSGRPVRLALVSGSERAFDRGKFRAAGGKDRRFLLSGSAETRLDALTPREKRLLLGSLSGRLRVRPPRYGLLQFVGSVRSLAGRRPQQRDLQSDPHLQGSRGSVRSVLPRRALLSCRLFHRLLVDSPVHPRGDGDHQRRQGGRRG